MTRLPAIRPVTSTGVALLASGVILAACSPGSPEAEPPEGETSAPAEATEAEAGDGPAPLEPGDEQPEGTRLVEWQGLQIAVPQSWTEESPSDSDPRLFLLDPDHEQLGVMLLAGDGQAETAEEALTALEHQLSSDGWDHTLHADLDWPGADDAGLVQFIDEESAEDVDFETWQLVVDGPDGRTHSVLGFAPVEEFSASGIPDYMASFRLTG